VSSREVIDFTMQVVQSVPGKFHHFHLARQLHQRRMLARIFSSYPNSKLRNEEIPPELLRTHPFWHLLFLASARSSGILRKPMIQLAHLDRLTFDRYVAKNLPECDVFIGLSGSALLSGTKAQRLGGKYLCDRGSSHIRYADQILREEFQRWGEDYQGIDPRNIALEEQEYAVADLITVPSEFVVRSFLEMGIPRQKIRKVPYGADLSRFSKVADPDLESFDVLFVGQVSIRKGVPYLLEAFAKLRHSKKKLTVVGSVLPEMAGYLKGENLSGVEFMGPVPHTRLKEIMSRSHVMVLPSLEEGLAMVQGEALACGCPVIASENTGSEDLFTDGREGFIVPIRSTEAILESLKLLSQDSSRREKMSEACLKRVAEIGGWDDYGRGYVSVLESLTETVVSLQ